MEGTDEGESSETDKKKARKKMGKVWWVLDGESRCGK